MNTGLVAEVVALANSAHLLCRRKREAFSGRPEERSFARARALASDEVVGPEELSWTDIREREMSRVHEVRYSLPNRAEIEAATRGLLDVILVAVRRTLPPEFEAIYDDVCADLHNCARARAVGGTRFAFFETQLDIYARGGWPCGWRGDYPSGEVVVFVPDLKAAQPAV